MRFKFFSVLLVAISLSGIERGFCFSTRTARDYFLNGLLDESSGEAPDEETSPENIESSTDNSQKSCPRSTRRNTDEFIDKVLEEVRPKLPKPASLPERTGHFKLFNGTLNNLATLERTGPAMVRCTDTTFSFLVPIGLNNLTGKYFWEMDSGLPVFRGFINLFISRAEADVLYTRERKDLADSSESELPQRAMIEQLKISKLEGVRVRFDGLGPFNKVASRLTNLVARFFSQGVARVLEGPVRKAINKELMNVEKYEKYFF